MTNGRTISWNMPHQHVSISLSFPPSVNLECDPVPMSSKCTWPLTVLTKPSPGSAHVHSGDNPYLRCSSCPHLRVYPQNPRWQQTCQLLCHPLISLHFVWHRAPTQRCGWKHQILYKINVLHPFINKSFVILKSHKLLIDRKQNIILLFCVSSHANWYYWNKHWPFQVTLLIFDTVTNKHGQNINVETSTNS